MQINVYLTILTSVIASWSYEHIYIVMNLYN